MSLRLDNDSQLKKKRRKLAFIKKKVWCSFDDGLKMKRKIESEEKIEQQKKKREEYSARHVQMPKKKKKKSYGLSIDFTVHHQ